MSNCSKHLRYRSGGELHRDFHWSTSVGIHYLLENYGEEALREVLHETAVGVYRQMHEKLCAGDPSELLEFWRYYYGREGGEWSLEETADGGAVLTVSGCPALRHLQKLGVEVDPVLCKATEILNNELVSGSPFSIETRVTGAFSCVQTLKRSGCAK